MANRFCILYSGLLCFVFIIQVFGENCCESCPEARKSLMVLLESPISESPCVDSCLEKIYLAENAEKVKIVCQPCKTNPTTVHDFIWDFSRKVDRNSIAIKSNSSASVLQISSVKFSHSGHYQCRSKQDGNLLAAFRQVKVCNKVQKPENVSCVSKSNNKSEMFFSCSWQGPSRTDDCSSHVTVHLQDGSNRRKPLELPVQDTKCSEHCETALTRVGELKFEQTFTLLIGIKSSAEPWQQFEFQLQNLSSIYSPQYIAGIKTTIFSSFVDIRWRVPSSLFHQPCPSRSSIFRARVVIISSLGKTEIRKFHSLALERDANHYEDTKYYYACMAHITLGNLVPYQQYTVLLRYGIEHSTYASPVKIIDFQTLPSAPTNAAVKLLPGSILQVEHMCHAYWEDIPKELHYGKQFSVSSSIGNVHRGNSFVSFPCRSTELMLTCRNEAGSCHSTSKLHIWQSAKVHPVELVVTRRKPKANLATVFWKNDYEHHGTLKFSVLWCFANSWTRCKAGVHQQYVSPRHHSLTVTVPDRPVVFAVSRCIGDVCSFAVPSIRTFPSLGAPGPVEDLDVSKTGTEGSFVIHWQPPEPVEYWTGLPLSYEICFSLPNTNFTNFQFHTLTIGQNGLGKLLKQAEISMEVNCSMFSYKSVLINVRAVNWPGNSVGSMTQEKLLDCSMSRFPSVSGSIGFGIGGLLTGALALILVSVVIYGLCQKLICSWFNKRDDELKPDDTNIYFQVDASSDSSGSYDQIIYGQMDVVVANEEPHHAAPRLQGPSPPQEGNRCELMAEYSESIERQSSSDTSNDCQSSSPYADFILSI